VSGWEAEMTKYRVGTREEWLAARTELLEREKELTRRSDELGWSFPWVSAAGSDFNLDFAVFTEEERRAGTGFNFGTPKHAAEIDLRRDELHGLSAFALEDGVVYHTYSCYDCGTDVLSATWQLLDRTPKGRGDDPEGWPRRHDEYPADA
jgi:predicted dithiol-disulfide oxidoreductase (DUF899 family)